MVSGDVIFDYGVGAVLTLVSVILILIAYNLGYSFGYHDGFKAGGISSTRFGQRKIGEQKINNN